MKKIAITLGAVLFTIVGVQAQNNRDITKETVTKKVTTTDAYSKSVKVIEEVDEKVDVLVVPETGREEITPVVVTKKTDAVNVITDQTDVDIKKKASDAGTIANTEASLQRELEKSKMVQANQEKLKRNKYEASQKLLEVERLERKAVLTRKVGQSEEEAKMQSAELQQALKEYSILLENAKKTEMLMKQM